MEILISANEIILAIIQKDENGLLENMTEEEYMKWFNKTVKAELDCDKCI